MATPYVAPQRLLFRGNLAIAGVKGRWDGLIVCSSSTCDWEVLMWV